ncbi:MAG: hypothetical protein IJX28_04935 [Clostridia bacterium]|nr:hypothetical protein [Clostridia bacterium]
MTLRVYIQKGVILLLLCLLGTVALGIPTRAEESEPAETLPFPEDEFRVFLESIPEEILEHLPPELFSITRDGISDATQEMSGFSYLLTAVLSALETRLGDCLGLLATTVGLLLLCALCRHLCQGGRGGEAFSFCASLLLLSGLMTRGLEGLRRTVTYFSTLTQITAGILPLLSVLYALGGNLTVATASTAGLSVYMTLLEEWVGQTILPFCACCLVFSMLQALHPALRMGTLLISVKKNYTTLLAFLMMLLLAMLSAQTVLGARNDTLLMRSAKFAAGNLIPVVGGSVAELLRSVSAGVGYLRGTVGICAVLLLLFTLLPTLIELFLIRLTWQISAAVADLLGCDGEKKLLEEFASLNGYLLAAVCICSSVLVLSVCLLIHSAAAIG